MAKSKLISGGNDSGEELPLQVQIDPDWVMFLIYSENKVDTVETTSTPSGHHVFQDNIWTSTSLTAIRDLEAPVRNSPDFRNFCLSDQDVIIPVSPLAEKSPTFTDVVCARASFLSPLDLIYFSGFLPNDLETITQDELDKILLDAINDPETWMNFKNLFDAEVTADNLNVRFIRSQLLFAGPFQYDTGKVDAYGWPIYERYKDMSDRFDD